MCVVCAGQGKGARGLCVPFSALSLPSPPSPMTFPSVMVGVPPFCSGLWGGVDRGCPLMSETETQGHQ